jgi:hypothetical protein
MIITARRAITSRSGSTTIMFAAFAAVLTLGIMMLSRNASHQMVAFVNKQPAIRY